MLAEAQIRSVTAQNNQGLVSIDTVLKRECVLLAAQYRAVCMY